MYKILSYVPWIVENFTYHVDQLREIAVSEQRMGKDHLSLPTSLHQSLQPQYRRNVQGSYFWRFWIFWQHMYSAHIRCIQSQYFGLFLTPRIIAHIFCQRWMTVNECLRDSISSSIPQAYFFCCAIQSPPPNSSSSPISAPFQFVLQEKYIIQCMLLNLWNTP